MDFLQNIIRYDLEHLPFIILSLLLCFTIHEFAHAYTAYKFGDDTAYKLGRVTLNPLAHLDFFGFALILIAGFGWAKPVPVSASRFKKPRQMSIIVSFAGPFSNFVLGFIAIVIYALLIKFGVVVDHDLRIGSAINLFFGYLIFFNFLLLVFNLIPLPPLDGYRILSELLPLNIRWKLQQQEHWGAIIFLILVFIPFLRQYTIEPVLALGQIIQVNLMQFIFQLFQII